MADHKRLGKVWNVFSGQIATSTSSTEKFAQKYKEAIELATQLSVNDEPGNKLIVERIAALTGFVFWGAVNSEGEIRRFHNLFFWYGQEHYTKDFKSIIMALELFCQSVIFKYLEETKSLSTLVELSAKYTNSGSLSSVSYRENVALTLSQTLATIFTKEALTNVGSLPKVCEAIGFLEKGSPRLEGLSVLCKRLEEYKKIRNILEHGGGHTSYYRAERRSSVENFSRVVITDNTVGHAARLSVLVGRIMHKTFNSQVPRRDSEILSEFKIERGKYSVINALRHINIKEREVAKLLKAYFLLRENNNDNEALSILLACMELFPARKFPLSHSVVKMLARRGSGISLQAVKRATEASFIYLDSLSLDEKYLHIMNMAILSKAGFMHTIYIFEHRPDFLNRKKPMIDIIRNSSYLHTLSPEIQAYVRVLDKRLLFPAI
jgi:hypothetical protein